MNKVLKASLGIAAAAAIVGSNVASTMVALAYGDNAGGRQKYTIEQLEAGALGKNGDLNQKVVLNSIMEDSEAKKSGQTGNTLGSELNFVAARKDDGSANGPNNVLYGNTINAEDGQYYWISMYVHNNNPNGTQAIAEGVKTYFTVPGETSNKVTVGGVINMNAKGSGSVTKDGKTTATNVTANVTEYWDTVDFTSDHAFHLEYVGGSGILQNNGIGARSTTTIKDKTYKGAHLDDAIVKDGVLIGYDALNGKVPGCFQYANWVGIKVKVVYDNVINVDKDVKFTVDKKVRMAGTKDEFAESVEAKVGDKVEYQIDFHNTSTESLKNVTIKDVLPKNAKLVAGTTVLYNSLVPKGQKFSDNIETGINIGDYAADAHGFIRFTAEIVDNSLACGKNRLINWGLAGAYGKSVKDNADVLINKTGGVCENQPTPPDEHEDNPGEDQTTTPTTVASVSSLPSTGPAGIITGVIGAGSVVTTAGYYIASRKH
ncbi:DUF11 domain-containing protein [Candidatus Saccharibacteria bacterium]|nr:DUF11 domain-containing protein [Candidatus Saccharibacteria bacterium]